MVGFLTWLLIGILGLSIGAGIVAFILAIVEVPAAAATAGTAGAMAVAGAFPADSAGRGRTRRRGLRRRRWRIRGRRRQADGEHHGLETLVRHAFSTRQRHARAFSRSTLDAIEAAITASEKLHGAEIRFAIEGSLEPHEIWRGKARGRGPSKCSHRWAPGTPRPTTAS